VKRLIFSVFILIWFIDPAACEEIRLLKVDGAIDPVVVRYLLRNVEEAEREGSLCLILELDTPGGVVEAMENVVKGFLNARVPIVVYVAPPGAKAASAGTFITLAAHVAAMAPGTFLGAAHPVQMGRPPGEEKVDDEVMKKAVNALLAQMENICKQRDRNPSWPKKAILESVTASSEELLEMGVIDILAKDRDELIRKLEGREIRIGEREITLSLKKSEVKAFPMSLSERFLHALANPNIALILLSLGVLALIQEFATPGIGLGGIVGGVFLILALFSLGMLPINLAGILLFIFGMILLLLEAMTPGLGLLSIGGVVSMILGGFMLVDTTRAPFYTISWQLLFGLVLSIALFVLFVVSKVVRIHRRAPLTGQKGLIGKVGYAKGDFVNGKGTVYVDGAYWSGRSDEPVKEGEEVVVIGIDGYRLRLKRKEE
jgi:membrane-bound serine protease (ClpP class)